MFAHVRLSFELDAERACPLQRHASTSSTRKNREQARCRAAWSGLIREGCSCAPHWWRQSRTVPSVSRILTEVVMGRRRLGLAKSDWAPFEAARDIADADDRPCAFHRVCFFNLPTPPTRQFTNSPISNFHNERILISSPSSHPDALGLQGTGRPPRCRSAGRYRST